MAAPAGSQASFIRPYKKRNASLISSSVTRTDSTPSAVQTSTQFGPAYGPFSPSARIAVLVGQIVVPSLGGPLLGVALGRWVRFPGAAFVLFLVIFGWVQLVTILTISRPDSAPIAVLRLFSPFAFFTLHADVGGVSQ